ERSLLRFDTNDSGVALANANDEHLDSVRRAYGWRSSGQALVERLEGEGLVTNDRRTLTMAGALTLLDDPTEVMGKAFVEVIRFPDDGVDYDKRIEIAGPVQSQVAAATDAVMDELGTDLVVSGVR